MAKYSPRQSAIVTVGTAVGVAVGGSGVRVEVGVGGSDVGVDVGVGGNNVAVGVVPGVSVAVGVGLDTIVAVEVGLAPVVAVLVAEAGGSGLGVGADVSICAGVRVAAGRVRVGHAREGPHAPTIKSTSIPLRTSNNKRPRFMSPSPGKIF